MGYEDVLEAEGAGLTTIRVDKTGMGGMATRRLMELIEDPRQERQVHTFPTRLLERESVGRP